MELARMNMYALLVAVVCALLVNVPFGFWRAGARKFSLVWFMGVHAPIPFIVAIRLLAGVGWHLKTFPLFVVAYFGGQCVGGALRRRRQRSGA